MPERWNLFKVPGCFKAERLCLAIILLLGLASFWMTLNREQAYAVRCQTESDLYQLAESPRIEGFRFYPADGQLVIEMTEVEEENWTIQEQGKAITRSAGADPILTLELGLQHFDLLGQKSGVQFAVHTQWVPGAAPVVTPTPIRIGDASPFSIEDFVMDLNEQPDADLAKARKLLAAMPHSAHDPALERIAKIAAFLEHQLNSRRGAPGPQMNSLNGIDQYTEALEGRSKVYCANHAEIFAYFANVAGLPTRLIDVRGAFDDISLGAHTFNEVYVADLNQWIYIDLQTKTVGIRDASGQYLSAAELIRRLHFDSTAGLVVRALEDGTFVDRAFDEFDEGEGGSHIRSLLSSESAIVYLSPETPRFTATERLKRLLLSPSPALCSGGIEHHPNQRIAATFLTLLVGFYWLIRRLRHALGRCSCLPAA